MTPFALILSAGLAQSLFMAIVWWQSSGGRRSVNRLLGLFFLVLALNIAYGLLYQSGLYHNLPWLIGAQGLLQLALGPALWFYVRSQIRSVNPSIKRDWPHLVPFAAYLALNWSFLSASDLYKFALMFSWFQGQRDAGEYLARFWFETVVHLQTLAYLAVIARTLLAWERHIRNNFSSIDSLAAAWLRRVLLAFGGAALAGLGAFVALLWSQELLWLLAIGPLVQTMVAFYIGGLAFLRPKLFLASEILPAPEPVPAGEVPALAVESNPAPADGGVGKYEKSQLPEAYARRLLGNLERVMAESRLYTDPDLTLTGLAEHLHASRNHLSQVLNQNLGQSFYDYINRLRVLEVARRLRDPEFQDLSIIEIASDCGFNSKSTFNKVFKAVFSLAPSEYRQERRESIPARSCGGSGTCG